jgi:acyl-coenzyme A thioesterase PaaI-like protein
MSETANEQELRFPDSGCFGCSRTNPRGLGLRFFRQGEEIVTRYTIASEFCGAPGVAHGGILATIIDEVSCAVVAFLRGTYVVTGELTVRYLLPCPASEEIEVRARIMDERPRYLVVESEVSRGGTLIARSTGRFFPVSPLHGAP